jgi:hypothetical protein
MTEDEKTKEYYRSLTLLVIHAETISWTRFYNFLVSSTILVMAWVTVFIKNPPSTSSRIIMLVLSAFGFIMGICFSALGYRSRQYLNLYHDQARAIEEGKETIPTTKISIRPFTEDDTIRHGGHYESPWKSQATIASDRCFCPLWRFILGLGTLCSSRVKNRRQGGNHESQATTASDRCFCPLWRFILRRGTSHFIIVKGSLAYAILFFFLFCMSTCAK